MKPITIGYRLAINSAGRRIKNLITYTENNQTITLDDDDIRSVNANYKGGVLKSVMKQLDIDSYTDIPLNTVLNYQFGVMVNDELEYISFGNYVVYKSEKQEDTNSYKITCYDKMLYSMVDYESMGLTYPISIRDYINAICNKLGLTFKNATDTFANYNKQIQNELYLDSEGNSLGYTFRDVLDELAQVTASTICINENDDELEIRYINDLGTFIDEDFLKNVNVSFGEKYGPVNSIVLSRSNGSDNVYLRDETSVTNNGLCEIKITDNQIMNFNDRSDYLPDILYTLDGLQYYLNDFDSTGITFFDLCDKYTINVGENEYSCIMFNDEINITQGLEEKIYTDMPEDSETDYKKADKTDRKINQTYLLVDKQNQIIQSVVSNVNEQNNKISQITQTVDEINAKISDVTDITVTAEDTDGQVELDNVNESEPIQIKIRPIGENISYLYPRSNLYPSSTLYPKNRKLQFTRTYTEEGQTKTQNILYELPDDLLYYNQDTYDEFYLDYDSQTCQVTKRCKYNANGTVELLTNEETISYPYPTISLGTGDYTVTLLGYNNAYLFVRLIASNIYTTQFATKVEMTSAINQTASEINLEVSKKVGNDEVISKINQSAEAITINANKVNIAGTISAINNNTTTTINGSKITTGSITSSQIATNAITADKIQAGAVTSSKVSSDIITTSNLSAQNISGNQIRGGTISGQTISGGTINGTSIYGGTVKIGSRETTIDGAGNVSIYPDDGGVFRFAGGGVRLNAKYGVAITSNGGTNIYAADSNLDLKACYGGIAYLACTRGNATDERSAVSCEDGTLRLRSVGAIYANGVAIGGSSSKATKKNIKDLTKKQRQEIVDLIENIPLKQYDYKKQYGKKFNYGFLIEDIENTKLNDLLHITQNENNKDIKVYSSEDLTRIELVVIQELIKKNHELEERIMKLERESDK